MARVELNRNQLAAERRLFETVDFLRGSHNWGFRFVPYSHQFDDHEESIK